VQIITRAQVASVLGILLIMATSQEGLFLISCSASFQQSDWLTAWPNHGGGLLNQRYAYLETKISPKSVRQLQLKWTVQTRSDVTATPCVVDNVVYVPSWNGFVYAASASTGTVLWQTNLTKVAGSLHNIPTVVCRTTPTVAGNYLLIGIYSGGYVLALDRRTGAFVWSTQLDANPYAGVTMSGTVYGGYEPIPIFCLSYFAALQNSFLNSSKGFFFVTKIEPYYFHKSLELLFFLGFRFSFLTSAYF
jgi:glucose dehydrogenase